MPSPSNSRSKLMSRVVLALSGGVDKNHTVACILNQPHGQRLFQFAATGLVYQAFSQPCSQDVQFGFTHRTLVSQQQTIVEMTGIIRAIFIENQHVGERAYLQKSTQLCLRNWPTFVTAKPSHLGMTWNNSAYFHLYNRKKHTHAREPPPMASSSISRGISGIGNNGNSYFGWETCLGARHGWARC